MNISVWVPYDEQQQRRTVKFILGPQLRTIRVVAVVASAVGVVLGLAFGQPTRPSSLVFPVVLVLLGAYYFFGVPARSVSRSLRVASATVKQGMRLTLDGDWLTLTYPDAETRVSWSRLGQPVETVDAWYFRLSRVQAFTIPKSVLSVEQQAEFARFLSARQLGQALPYKLP